MHKLLILLLLLESGVSFSQNEDTYQDLVHQTSVHYTSSEEDIENPDFDLLESVEFIQLKDGQWPGAKKTNILIRNELNTLKSPEFSLRFEREYAKALKNTLIDYHQSCVKESGNRKTTDCGHYSDFARYFTPDQVQAEFSITSLCNHILVAGMNISFTAAREQDKLSVKELAFQDLHYYDLIQGIEIDPSTILDTRKLPEFYRLVKSRIPGHLKKMADTLDLKKGLPLFNGAGFYYFIEGNIETYSENQSILQIRLSLEEVSPFLNSNGPFKAYIPLKTSNTNHNGLMSGGVEGSAIQPLKELQSLRTINLLMENLSGKEYANKRVYIRSDQMGIETQITFNKFGQPTNKKTVLKEEGSSVDSTAFTYDVNGKLKAIDLYELKTVSYIDEEKREELKLIKTSVFDEQQNLIKRTEYHVFDYRPDDIETDTDYYTYLKDRIIQDASYETNCTSTYEWGATEYLISEGAAFYSQDNDRPINSNKYSTRSSGDTTFLELTDSKKTKICIYYIQTNNQVTEFMEQQGLLKTKITYDNLQRPVSYSIFKQSNTGYEPFISTSVEYDSKNRPIKYNYQFPESSNNPNKLQVYQFRYE